VIPAFSRSPFRTTGIADAGYNNLSATAGFGIDP
jgi:hypothetical protein